MKNFIFSVVSKAMLCDNNFKSKMTGRELLGACNIIRKYTTKNQSKSQNKI